MSKLETSRSESVCNQQKEPTKEGQSVPEQIIEESAFTASGKTDAKNPGTLAGTQKLPDGNTTISWNLKLYNPNKKSKQI